MIKKITNAMVELDIKVVHHSDDINGLEDLAAEEHIDMALVDVSSDGADRACQYASKSLNIPVLLVINQRQADWEKIKSLRADGYILNSTRNGELMARLKAAVRRNGNIPVKVGRV